MRRTLDILSRFWSKVDTSGECWVWTKASTNGYGRFWDGERVVLATRWLWEFICGPLQPGQEVAHHCDNPPCVRPSHLFAATHQENIIDMVRKGRGGPPRHAGETHPRAKLTQRDVDEIRRSLTGSYGEKALLARAYNVSPSTVGRIAAGVLW